MTNWLLALLLTGTANAAEELGKNLNSVLGVTTDGIRLDTKGGLVVNRLRSSEGHPIAVIDSKGQADKLQKWEYDLKSSSQWLRVGTTILSDDPSNPTIYKVKWKDKDPNKLGNRVLYLSHQWSSSTNMAILDDNKDLQILAQCESKNYSTKDIREVDCEVVNSSLCQFVESDEEVKASFDAYRFCAVDKGKDRKQVNFDISLPRPQYKGSFLKNCAAEIQSVQNLRDNFFRSEAGRQYQRDSERALANLKDVASKDSHKKLLKYQNNFLVMPSKTPADITNKTLYFAKLLKKCVDLKEIDSVGFGAYPAPTQKPISTQAPAQQNQRRVPVSKGIGAE